MMQNTENRPSINNIAAIEIGCDDVIISCTLGKITIWFGKQANEGIVKKVVFSISRIDSTVSCEQEIICDFNDIPKFENNGYILSSYAKAKGGYKAIFTIPFSKKVALTHFVALILEQLKTSDVRKNLHWDGNPHRMKLIQEEMTKLEGWRIKNIEYKQQSETD